VLIAVCGGVYSNPYALAAFAADARARGAERLYCLGDLGGYGAEPDAVWPLLVRNNIECVAGNYDVAISQGAADCGCGYSDPRDREYAQIMYDFTVAHTSPEYATWMSGLPTEHRDSLGNCDVHFVHGSPAGLNDFWWESLPDRSHAARIAASGARVIFCTHSGLPWIRRFDETLVTNVGVIGRPPNDGRRHVRYALARLSAGRAAAQIVTLGYDWRAQASAMRRARLPEPFIHTTEEGWWTTCLEVLPAEERSRGRYHVYESSVPALLQAAEFPLHCWPDSGQALPVRSLYGSPFLPDRIWLADAKLATADLIAQASAAGVGELRSLGATAPLTRSIGGTAELLVPELTLGHDGWHWHPDQISDQPFLPAGPDKNDQHGQGCRNGQSAASIAAARRRAVRRLLEHFNYTGALGPPRACVS
jgi:hypothetical protein